MSDSKQTAPSAIQTTNADRIIDILRRAGVQRLFGMPGGGSPADLMEAAQRVGFPFSLALTETGSAFMATAQAEITGKPGACVATLGPGAASLVNGVSNALLERAPIIAMTDCYPDDILAFADHQTLPHERIFEAVTKRSARPTPANIEQVLYEAIAIATNAPQGPVHLDVTQAVTGHAVESPAATSRPTPAGKADRDKEVAPAPSQGVRDLLQRSRRPVFLVGLGARTAAVASAIRSVSESQRIPALVTYKAKGVVPDRHPWFGGVVTNGALERTLLDRADLFIAIGLDPVELLARHWTFAQPVISISAWSIRQRQVPIAAEMVGDVSSILEMVKTTMRSPAEWTAQEVESLITQQRAAMRPSSGSHELVPHQVVDIVAETYEGSRATVDAGAHMFPVLWLWPAGNPCDVLISNGLSTMGFALPAAIGAALLDRSKPVVAFTGDGGLLMCLGELQTAVREAVPVRIVVFDDGALSLIRIKQLERGYATDGTGLGSLDWASVGAGLGLVARQVNTIEALRSCLAETAGHPGPVLIAATVNPSVYPATIRALRG